MTEFLTTLTEVHWQWITAITCVIFAISLGIIIFFTARILEALAKRSLALGKQLIYQILLTITWPLRAIILFAGILGMTHLINLHFSLWQIVDANLQSLTSSIGTILMVWLGWNTISATEKYLVTQNEARDEKDKYNLTTISALTKLLRIVLLIIGSLSFLQSIGANLAGIIAAGGVGGIAIGFASRDLLANFFGGLLLYIERPFRVGEWILVPSHNLEGTVEDIGFRMTRLRTFDQRPLFIPNAIFTNVAVENPSRMTNRRIYETIGVRYEDSLVLEHIVHKIKQRLLAMPEIDTTRTIIVNFNAFAPSSLDIIVYCFTKTTEWITYHHIKQQVLFMIIRVVDEQGASIAYPTSTIHLQQEKS